MSRYQEAFDRAVQATQLAATHEEDAVAVMAGQFESMGIDDHSAFIDWVDERVQQVGTTIARIANEEAGGGGAFIMLPAELLARNTMTIGVQIGYQLALLHLGELER